MPLLSFTSLVFLGSFLAGLLGALTGLGGGVVLIPLLTLAFHVDMRYAIGASLISVIATSSGAAAAYVREGLFQRADRDVPGGRHDVWRGVGGLPGDACSHPRAGRSSLAWCCSIRRGCRAAGAAPAGGEGERQSLVGQAGDVGVVSGPCARTGDRATRWTASPAGFATMFGAGTLSGLLGIGSGAVKVLAMDKLMRIPFKVSTTTSNFMIGVTAAASAGIYLARGYVDPGLAFPVMLGVLAGSLLGAKVLVHSRVSLLRTIFAFVIAALGIEMIVNGWLGKV